MTWGATAAAGAAATAGAPAAGGTAAGAGAAAGASTGGAGGTWFPNTARKALAIASVMVFIST